MSDGHGNDASVKFGADTADLEAGLKKVTGSVNEVFEELQSKMVMITGLLAGGAAFKHFIESTNEMNSEAKKLAQTLGLTGEEAGYLSVALNDIGSSADTYSGMMMRFTRQLKGNEEGLKAMGLQTRDASNHLRDASTLFSEALKIVGTYKQGMDQTTTAMTFFGRNVGDVQRLMRLNNEVMEEAKRKSEELGLTVTEEGMKMSREYKRAMNDVHDVMDGISKVIGEAMMPRFIEMGQWFASEGPGLVAKTREAMLDFKIVMESLTGAAKEVVIQLEGLFSILRDDIDDTFGEDGRPTKSINLFTMVLETIGTILIMTARVIKTVMAEVVFVFEQAGRRIAVAALLLNPFSSKEAYEEGLRDLERALLRQEALVLQYANEEKEALDKLWGRTKGETKAATPAGVQGVSGDKTRGDLKTKQDGTAQALAAKEKAELEAKLALEKEHFAEAQSIYDDAFKNSLISIQEYYAAKLYIEQAGLRATIETKKAEMAAVAAAEAKAPKEQEKIKLQTQQIKLKGELTVLEDKLGFSEKKNAMEATAAQKKFNDSLAETANAILKAEGEAQIDKEKMLLDEKLSLRKIDEAQQIQGEVELENRRYAIQVAYYNNKRELAKKDEEKLAQIRKEELASETDHQKKLLALEIKANADKNKYRMQFTTSMESGFKKAFTGILNGTMTLGQAVKSIFKSMGDAIIEILAGIAAKWAANQLAELIGVTTTAESGIAAKAAEAGAGGVASMASAPFPINLSAPAFGAAMSAAAMAYQGLVAAKGFAVGLWKAPEDMVTKIHKGESVVPTEFADKFREGGGGDQSPVQVHISAMDARSVRDYFKANSHVLAPGLRRMARNFTPTRGKI